MSTRSISRPGASRPAAPAAAPTGFALFNLGFRPFYLAAAACAAIGMPLWLLSWAGLVELPGQLPAQWWHMHEMVYGFALAVVIGFLFTASRVWTGQPTPTGGRLAALVGLWLAARILLYAGMPLAGIAVEVLLIALAAAAILRVLLAGKNHRNLFVVVILATLAALDVAFALALHGTIGWVADTPLRAALYLIVMLTAVFGGRVIPAFTANALFGIRQYRRPWLDIAALAGTLAALLAELLPAPAVVVASLAGLAAVLHALRLAGWNPIATRARPILWSLHLAYAWMPLGFALLAAAALGLVARPLALHAFATGLIGGLIMAMITRTSLGHTGRPLRAAWPETTMYLLIFAAALARVAGPLLAPAQTVTWYTASGLAWSGAFLLYLLVYGPRLSRPRIDARPG